MAKRNEPESTSLASGRTLASIADAFPANIALVDHQGTIIGVNRHWKQFARDNGYIGSDAGIGINYIALCNSVNGDVEAVAAARKMAAVLRAVLAGERGSFQLEYPCHAPLRQRWCIAIVAPLPGRRRRAVVLHLDITDRKKAEEALRQARDVLEYRVEERTRDLQNEINRRIEAEMALRASEERYRGIVEDQTELVCRFRPDMTITFTNPAYAAYFGEKPEALVGRNLLDHVPPEMQAGVTDYLASLTPEAPVARSEWRSTGPDGETTWHIWTTRGFFGADDAPVEFQGVGTDISELKRTEEALVLAKARAEQASRVKSQFLAAASHDLRQPLQTIGALLGVLSKLTTGEQATRAIRALGEAQRSMAILLDTLLDINRLEVGADAPELGDFPIAELLDLLFGEFEPLAREKGIELRVVRSELIVHSDFGFLKQLVQNLVSNAAHHTPGGRILIGCRRSGPDVRIEVWDTGIGIAADQLDRIFEEFYQIGNVARQRDRGFGLGLAIVRRVADLLGHPITVRSTPGKGSVFSVTVPRGAAQRPAPVTGSAEKSDSEVTGALLLVIEDDAAVLEALEMMLTLEGFRVAAATNSADALGQMASTEELPAAIIADYRLPDGETGLDAVRRVRQRAGQEIPAVILTGELLRTETAVIEQAGLALLRKPVMPNELLTLLRSVLQSSP